MSSRGTSLRRFFSHPLADARELLAVELDSRAIAADLRIENGFPHVYGAIPVSAAVARHRMTRNSEGQWSALP